MLDSIAVIEKFVKIVLTKPEVAKAPFILDPSKFEIYLVNLKWCQRKLIMNSILLKVGKGLFFK